MAHLLLTFSLLLLLLSAVAAAALPPPPPLLNRYAIHGAPFPSATTNASQLIIDPTLPQPLDAEPPACSLPLLQFDFRGPAASSAAANYTPPDPENCTWTHASLEISASAEGESPDRVGSLWLHGVEILRTSTPVSTEAGVYWKIRRDVTRYSAALRRDGVVSMAFEGAVGNATDAGAYRVNATLNFYDGSKLGGWGSFPRKRILNRKLNQHQPIGDPRLHDLDGKPADRIVPLSTEGDDSQGFWHTILNDSDTYTTTVSVPQNTRRAILEVFISAHADDEFWYSNPPDYYYEMNNLPVKRGNGPIRQLSVAVDGLPVSYSVPFPAVYSGGVNPLFWIPVAPIGSFNLPSHDVELTPILGQLLDGEAHEFAIGITSALPFWLVGANLHLWLDPNVTVLTAGVIEHRVPEFGVSTKSKSTPAKWEFQVKSGGKLGLSGWVASSLGNLTTRVEEDLELSGSIAFKNSGTAEEAEFEVESKRVVTVVEGESGNIVTNMTRKAEFKVEVDVKIATVGVVSYRSNVEATRAMKETVTVGYGGVQRVSTIRNADEGKGWMAVDEGGAAVAGVAKVEHKYRSIGSTGCYERKLKVRNGTVVGDQVINICTSDA